MECAGCSEPGGRYGTALYSVSCASLVACTAVGGSNEPADQIGAPPAVFLVERWNGTSWTAQPTPNATNSGAAYGAQLSGVSCVSATTCEAVGGTDSASNALNRAYGELWSGSGWTLQAMPDANNALAVSCSSTTACLAIGGESDDVDRVDTRAQANRFRVTGVKTDREGNVMLAVAVPGPGTIDVLETAWDDNVATVASLLQPAARRFAYARAHTSAPGPTTLQIHVTPNSRGQLLVRAHRYRVTLRLWVTYTSIGGRSRSIGIYGLHLPTHP